MDPAEQKTNKQPTAHHLEAEAEEILQHIEARTLYATRLIGILLRKKLTGLDLKVDNYDFDEMTAMFTDPTVRIDIYDIESSIEHFRDLIVEEPALQAVLVHLVANKYPFRYEDVPGLRDLFGLDSPSVQTAHQDIYGIPLSGIYSRHHVPDKRPFWLRLPGNALSAMMDDLAKEVEWVYLPSGQVLFERGDIGDGLYTVISGRVRIVGVGGEAEEDVVIERGRGSIFGEIAMLSGYQERTATIYAVRDTELARLSVAGFERLFINHPHFGLLITKLIVSGFREAVSREYQSSQLTTLAVVPLHKSVAINEFMEKLKEALSPFGPVYALNGERFDALLGDGACQTPEESTLNTKLSAWLTDLEFANNFVILATDFELTEWTKRCLRMADRTLLVADASQPADLTPIEEHIEKLQDVRIVSGVDLILLQPTRSKIPQGTYRWLELRQVNRNHHIHLNTKADLQKLGRMLAGRAIGLALSGGGARGLAHIGVIKALQESNIPIDAVAGTSFGAIIGASLGLEWDWKHIYEDMENFIRTRSRYFRPALPFVSLMEGYRLSRLFQSYYGQADLEDLWRFFICLSANLTQSKPEILSRGPVWSAVRASMSLPGVFPPVLRKQQILVDGGVISNLPSDILKERIQGGYVISSDTTVEDSEFYEYKNDFSSWQILWAHANPRIKTDRLPSIARITAETMALASKSQRPKQLANTDLLIHIPVEQYKMFDYDSHEQLFEIGYRTAVEALQDWEEY